MEIRDSIFAGTWYPSRPSECEEAIHRFLKEPSFSEDAPADAVCGIVPHAGWFFSGAIACNVIHALARSDPVDAFVLFGMHLHPHSPNYIMTGGAWDTPFGPIRVDSELALQLTRQFEFKIETAHDFTPDNTIELQLPFIKYFCERCRLIPIGVPPNRSSLDIGEAVAAAAQKTGKRIRVLGSTDLTHYGSNYGFSPKGTGSKALQWVKSQNDRKIIETMLSMDPEKVLVAAETDKSACCAGAAATALASAKAMGATKSHYLAYATSFDKSPGSSFVGYVGIIYSITSQTIP